MNDPAANSHKGVHKGIKYHMHKDGFHVGQEGEFLLRDSNKNPICAVEGRIISLMEGESSLYAMLHTDTGLRPGRLT